MKVEVTQLKPFGINKSFIKKLFTVIAKLYPRYANNEISVAFVDNKVIRELNKRYRRRDAVTDVLSFAERDSSAGKRISGGGRRRYLGEIVIAYPYARQQARFHKRTVKDELIILLAHGFLHLIGFVHSNMRESKLMQQQERKILSKFNVQP